MIRATHGKPASITMWSVNPTCCMAWSLAFLITPVTGTTARASTPIPDENFADRVYRARESLRHHRDPTARPSISSINPPYFVYDTVFSDGLTGTP